MTRGQQKRESWHSKTTIREIKKISWPTVILAWAGWGPSHPLQEESSKGPKFHVSSGLYVVYLAYVLNIFIG